MHDPYLYEGTSVLINKLGIKDQDALDEAEADYVVLRLKELAQNTLPGDYHTPHYFQMHNYIFQDIYDWAGQPRKIGIYKEEAILGGQSIEYSDPFDIVNDTRHILAEMREKPWHDMDIRKVAIEFCASLAELWKVHPFREGNTRTTITFCCLTAA